MRRLAFVVLAALPATGCIVHLHRHAETDTVYLEGPVETLVANLAAGDLTVRLADVEQPTLHRTWRWAGDKPDARAALVEGELSLDTNCGRAMRFCAVDHELLLPAPVPVYAHTGSGDITVEAALEVDLRTGSGDIALNDVDGNVWIETGSGDVRARNLFAARVDVITGSGDVGLQIEELFDRVRVKTGSGDVQLTVPPATYDISARTGSGDVNVRGVTSGSSGSRIDVQTGSGDILIRGD